MTTCARATQLAEFRAELGAKAARIEALVAREELCVGVGRGGRRRPRSLRCRAGASLSAATSQQGVAEVGVRAWVDRAALTLTVPQERAAALQARVEGLEAHSAAERAASLLDSRRPDGAAAARERIAVLEAEQRALLERVRGQLAAAASAAAQRADE